ncbi:5'-nucleotidase C-terminal domain-containing protein [Desulfovibrio sp. OttesenSCG-928-F07]|nr:5'-nucleotidase C-terminal domain-containing protein [Desulfovibrio sp. OttesenSCG-928-F07]
MQKTALVITFLFATLLYPLTLTAGSTESVWLVYASHMADIYQRGATTNHAKLMTALESIRAQHENVVFIHGGNYLGPSALSSYDKGAHSVGIMNYLEPDALGLGRRDFMHKEDELILRAGEAVYPFVASNIIDPLTGDMPKDIERDVIIHTGPYNLGFLSIISPSMVPNYLPQRVQITGDYNLVPALSTALRKEGANFVILTADLTPEVSTEELAKLGADLIFISNCKDSNIKTINNFCVVSHSDSGSDIIILELKKSANKSGLYVAGGQVVPLANYQPDPEVNAALERYTSLFKSVMLAPVGVSQTAFATETRPLRTGENAFANYVTDSMREYYNADIGFINSGGIRGNRIYEAGHIITRGDLQSEMPLHDTSCLIRVSGAVIKKAIEHGLEEVENAKGNFVQVSGIKYTFNPSLPAGSRLIAATFNGSPLEDEKIYSVSLPEYIATKGGGFSMFPGACDQNTTRPQQELLEIVRVNLAKQSPVSIVNEGRIEALK